MLKKHAIVKLWDIVQFKYFFPKQAPDSTVHGPRSHDANEVTQPTLPKLDPMTLAPMVPLPS